MKTNTKFIVTQDQRVANKLISEGFRLITHMSGTYTFENKPTQHFNFSEDDTKKLVYTNMLSL